MARRKGKEKEFVPVGPETPQMWVFAGTEDFLRGRDITRKVQQLTRQGYELLEVGPGSPLSSVLSGGVLFSSKRVLLVRDALELKEEEVLTLDRALEDPDTEIILDLPVNPPRPKKGAPPPDEKKVEDKYLGWGWLKSPTARLVARTQKKHISFRTPPPPWKAEAAVEDFLSEEARHYGLRFPGPLARALAAKVGTDFGVLSFELRKVSAIIPRGGEVTAEALKSVIAPIGEAGVAGLLSAVERCSAPDITRELQAVGRAGRFENIMQIVGLLAKPALRWLSALSLEARGVPPETAAREVGAHPFPYQNEILPTARALGEARVLRLIRALADAEEAVLHGHLDPWAVLATGLAAWAAR